MVRVTRGRFPGVVRQRSRSPQHTAQLLKVTLLVFFLHHLVSTLVLILALCITSGFTGGFKLFTLVGASYLLISQLILISLFVASALTICAWCMGGGLPAQLIWQLTAETGVND